MVLLMGLAALACTGEARPEVPAELLGRWVTDHADYRGRFFEVNARQLTIGTGVEPPTTHTIVDVEEDRNDEGHRLITLVYLNESSDPIRFPLTYDPDSGRLWPRNQSGVIWERTERRR